jgi:hypothetical protein
MSSSDSDRPNGLTYRNAFNSYSSAPPVKRLGGRARLLCDGTNLREGGEVRGKRQRSEQARYEELQHRNQLPAPNWTVYTHISAVREYGLVRSAQYTKIVFCACAITLLSSPVSIKPRLLPFESFPLHSYIPISSTIRLYSCWQCYEVTHKMNRYISLRHY